MKLTKVQREQVRNKFGGKCAYCGNPLPDRWHADHFEPVIRNWGKFKSTPCERPENHRIENMMPACPPCNISKHSLSLEAWRDWLTGHLRSLNAHHSIYRLMKAYGLVIETGNQIVFYFERVQSTDGGNKK